MAGLPPLTAILDNQLTKNIPKRSVDLRGCVQRDEAATAFSAGVAISSYSTEHVDLITILVIAVHAPRCQGFFLDCQT